MFVTFEGIEGSGKSTQAELLGEALREMGLEATLSREPGGSELGRHLRRILLDANTTELTDEAELFLYLADRAQHVAQMISPALERGAIVIVDRYVDSTLAYQGFGKGVHPDLIPELNRIASQGVLPELTFLLDLEPELGLRRARSRNAELGKEQGEGRFEARELAFHQRVREGYLRLADKEPRRIVRLDANRSRQHLQAEILHIAREKLSERQGRP